MTMTWHVSSIGMEQELLLAELQTLKAFGPDWQDFTSQICSVERGWRERVFTTTMDGMIPSVCSILRCWHGAYTANSATTNACGWSHVCHVVLNVLVLFPTLVAMLDHPNMRGICNGNHIADVE